MSALPHPRSRTRIPGSIGITSVSDSSSQSGFGPIRFSRIQEASYPFERV